MEEKNTEQKAKQTPPEKKPFESLTITDNYMFQAVMQNPDHVKPLDRKSVV